MQVMTDKDSSAEISAVTSGYQDTKIIQIHGPKHTKPSPGSVAQNILKGIVNNVLILQFWNSSRVGEKGFWQHQNHWKVRAAAQDVLHSPNFGVFLETTKWETQTVSFQPLSSLALEILALCFSSPFPISIPHPRPAEEPGNLVYSGNLLYSGNWLYSMYLPYDKEMGSALWPVRVNPIFRSFLSTFWSSLGGLSMILLRSLNYIFPFYQSLLYFIMSPHDSWVSPTCGPFFPF